MLTSPIFMVYRKECVDNLKVLELCSSESGAQRPAYQTATDDKTRWWAAIVLCARDWSCGSMTDADRCSHIILAPPEDIRNQVLVKALLHAYKVCSSIFVVLLLLTNRRSNHMYIESFGFFGAAYRGSLLPSVLGYVA